MDAEAINAEIINIEADALARRHDIDPERVRKIFCRLAEVGWLAPKFPFNTALDDAIAHVGVEKALEIFEEEDLSSLPKKTSLVDYLADKATPLYTLDEMADLIKNFRRHLTYNRKHLIQIGHPLSTYERSRWLDWRLGKLYFTKLPAIDPVVKPLAELDILLLDSFISHSTTFDRDEKGNLVFNYIWPKDPDLLKLDLDYGEQERGYTVAYAEASRIPGLSAEKAISLEGLRRPIFEVKLQILDILDDAVRRRDESRLWEKCFEAIRKWLSSEDIELLLEMDHFFHQHVDMENGAYSPYLDGYICHNAGLTDLLEVMGHCEKEIIIGTMDRTQHRLSHLPVFESFSPYDYRLKSYYRSIKDLRLIRGGFRPEYESILNDFLALESREKRFWEEYRTRVNDAIEDVVEVIIKEKMKRKFVHKFEPAVYSYSKYLKAHLEATGEAPPADFAGGTHEQSDIACVFKKDGEIWTVRFRGRTQRFKDSKGFRYIHLLLEQNGREMHVLDMIKAIEKPDKDLINEGYDRMGQDHSGDLGWGTNGNSGLDEVLDNDTKIDLRGRLSDIEGKLREAEDNDDIGKIGRLKDEKKKIIDYLSKAHGLGGRKRKFKSPEEKARINIVRSIDRAIGRIRAVNGPFARHLANSIRTGIYCSYSPDDDSMRWEL